MRLAKRPARKTVAPPASNERKPVILKGIRDVPSPLPINYKELPKEERIALLLDLLEDKSTIDDW